MDLLITGQVCPEPGRPENPASTIYHRRDVGIPMGINRVLYAETPKAAPQEKGAPCSGRLRQILG